MLHRPASAITDVNSLLNIDLTFHAPILRVLHSLRLSLPMLALSASIRLVGLSTAASST